MRVNDGEGEARGHGGIHGVSTGLHHFHSRLRRKLVNADHHGTRRMGRTHWRGYEERGIGHECCQEQRGKLLESHGI